jgi:hypothetical protein
MIFSIRLDIFYLPNLSRFLKCRVFQQPQAIALKTPRQLHLSDFSSTSGFPRAPAACSPKLALELVLRY